MLSIIVSLYNKEDFIEKCLLSLKNLNLSESEYEVIIVDDYSTDQSVAIVERFVESHQHFRLIKLDQNSGSPARPRNIAMQEARGDYMTLLDADDWLDAEGLPKLYKKLMRTNDDIGFGQIYRHYDNKTTKVARFASFDNQEHLNTVEIERIFRSVGPPGKVFKRSLVLNHNIQFKHFKYGEDKLFFIELFSKAKKASMITDAVYHVNRYSINESLVKETDKLEKAKLNLEVFNEVLKLDLDRHTLKFVVSRFLELDFIARLVHKKKYLKSNYKNDYHTIISSIYDKVDQLGFKPEELIKDSKYQITSEYLYQQKYEELEVYLSYMLFPDHHRKYIDEDTKQVYHQLPTEHEDLAEDFYAVYMGTRKLEGQLYEAINCYGLSQFELNKVSVRETYHAINEKEISYKIKDNQILIDHRELTLEGVDDINIVITYGGYHEVMISTSYFSINENCNINTDNKKLEFSRHSKKQKRLNKKYFTYVPDEIVNLKKIYSYNETEFNIKYKTINAGEILKPISIDYSAKGTPRFKLDDGRFITSNKEIVVELDEIKKLKLMNKQSTYLYKDINKVEVIKNCKIYNDISFKKGHLRNAEVSSVFDVLGIEYTKSFTPRLVIQEGYLTANKNFVREIK